jgi:hypothetical protein
MRKVKILWLALAWAALTACAPLKPAPWMQDTLYFGLSRPGGTVSEAQWQAFVDEEVTPRFPGGLTQWQATGQWRESGPVLKEDSRVLQILHPAGSAADEKIQALRSIYKKRFGQSSVLRVKNEVSADF